MTCTEMDSRRERHNMPIDATGLQSSPHNTINRGGAEISDEGAHGHSRSNE